MATVRLLVMPDRRRKSGSSGRATPKRGTPSPGRRPPRFDVERPVEIGRRPSSPAFLLLVAIMWIAVGVIAIISLTASWRLVPGIVCIGVGLLFLRGAGATVIRRDRGHSDG
jgi:hypothetical protein